MQVTPPPPAIISLLPSPLPLVVGASGTLTGTLNAGQLMNTEVTVIVDQPSPQAEKGSGLVIRQPLG